MPKGFNKANVSEKVSWIFEGSDVKNRPCVFISHKKEDSLACKIIVEYFKNAEIDYFLDDLDDVLQRAALLKKPLLITERIKEGIRNCSHMLVVISEKSYQSQWIPFEIGYGHATIIDVYPENEKHADKIKLSILTLKDISERELPGFMQSGYLIRGTKSLNTYISIISDKLEKSMISESLVSSNTQLSHSLDTILNWRL